MPGSRAARSGAVTKEVIEFLDSGPPLELEVAWEVGIGGGLWTTGLLLCQHMRRREGFYRQLLCGKRVLELGSGTGLVGLCVAQLGPAEVVLTDQADHLDLLTRNVRANLPPSSSPLSSPSTSSPSAAAAAGVSTPPSDSHSPTRSTTSTTTATPPCHDSQLHGSGCSDVGPLSGASDKTEAVAVKCGGGGGGNGGMDKGDRYFSDGCDGCHTKVAATTSAAAEGGDGGDCDNGGYRGGAVNVQVCEYDWNAEDVGFLRPPFDVVVGTDVAYSPELYDPLVKALLKVCNPETVIILGVTRTDTGRPFFEKLHAAGMDYCLIRTDDVEGAAGGSGAGENFVLLSMVLKKRIG